MKEYLMITFAETTMALYMERVCKQERKEGRIIPLPKAIDAGCGLVWATQNREKEAWQAFLQEKGIAYDKMVEVTM